MKKLAARKIPVIALIVSVVLLAGTVAAWLSLGDYIEGMNFSILKINSTVTMYAAVDSNRNGVPDLLDTPLVPDSADPSYYTEKYNFAEKGTDYAQSEDPVAELTLKDDITAAFPSQVFTYKFKLVNNSDTGNVLSFKYDTSVASGDTQLLNALSVRLGSVEADGSVVFYEKKYFGKDLSGENNKILDLMPAGEKIEINGGIAAQAGGNRRDFWVQIEMAPYKELTKQGIVLTEENYNGLQGKSLKELNFRIYFEVEIGDTSSASVAP